MKGRRRAVIERWQEILTLFPSDDGHALQSVLGNVWWGVLGLFQEVGCIPLSQNACECLTSSIG